jgi:hypothetical protein
MASNSLAALKASTTDSLPEPGLARAIPFSEGLSPSMKTWRSLSEKPRKSWMVMPHLRMRSAMEDTTALLMYRPDLVAARNWPIRSVCAASVSAWRLASTSVS